MFINTDWKKKKKSVVSFCVFMRRIYWIKITTWQHVKVRSVRNLFRRLTTQLTNDRWMSQCWLLQVYPIYGIWYKCAIIPVSINGGVGEHPHVLMRALGLPVLVDGYWASWNKMFDINWLAALIPFCWKRYLISALGNLLVNMVFSFCEKGILPRWRSKP